MTISNDNDRPIGLFHAMVAIVGLVVMFSPFAALAWFVYEVTK